jgi:hypothetical protein
MMAKCRPRRGTECLEHPHLLALGGDDARQHDVEQERRHTQEDERGNARKGARLPDLLRQVPVGELLVPTVSAKRSVALEQPVELRNDGRLRRAGGEQERCLVPGTLHPERGRRGLLLDPEDAVAPVVRDEITGPHLGDELGRQRDADDPELPPAAVDHGAEGVTRCECVGDGKPLADHHFVAAVRIDHAPLPDAEEVDCQPAIDGNTDHACRSGFFESRHVDDHLVGNARFQRGNAGDLPHLRDDGARGALHVHPEVAEAGGRVVRRLCVDKVRNHRTHRDEAGNPAGDDEHDGGGDAAHVPDVANRLAIEHAQPAGHGFPAPCLTTRGRRCPPAWHCG